MTDERTAEGAGPSCTWEDCDQAAIYCQGHAFELCQVSSPDEPRVIRMRLEEVLKTAKQWLTAVHDPRHDQLSRIGALAQFMGALKAAESSLERWPQ